MDQVNNKTLRCGLDNNNFNNNTVLHVCPKNKCCNSDGFCGGNTKEYDNNYCINTNGLNNNNINKYNGIVNGLFDNNGVGATGYNNWL